MIFFRGRMTRPTLLVPRRGNPQRCTTGHRRQSTYFVRFQIEQSVRRPGRINHEPATNVARTPPHEEIVSRSGARGSTSCGPDGNARIGADEPPRWDERRVRAEAREVDAEGVADHEGPPPRRVDRSARPHGHAPRAAAVHAAHPAASVVVTVSPPISAPLAVIHVASAAAHPHGGTARRDVGARRGSDPSAAREAIAAVSAGSVDTDHRVGHDRERRRGPAAEVGALVPDPAVVSPVGAVRVEHGVGLVRHHPHAGLDVGHAGRRGDRGASPIAAAAEEDERSAEGQAEPPEPDVFRDSHAEGRRTRRSVTRAAVGGGCPRPVVGRGATRAQSRHTRPLS